LHAVYGRRFDFCLERLSGQLFAFFFHSASVSLRPAHIAYAFADPRCDGDAVRHDIADMAVFA